MKFALNLDELDWKTGVLAMVCLFMFALAINEVSTFFIRQNLNREFQSAATKVTTLDQLNQVVGQFAPRFAQAQSIRDFFKNSRVTLNLSEAYDEGGYSDDDQQARDRFTEPKIDCDLLLSEILKSSRDIDDYTDLLSYPEYLSEQGIINVQAYLNTAQYQYNEGVKAYAKKCIGNFTLN